MTDSIQSLEIRLDMLSGDLERARRYGTGLILFVVYRAESARADLEQQLLDRIVAMGQRVSRVHFHPDDPPEARALMGQLCQEPPTEDEVIFVYGLRHAFPELLNSLNYRREFVPDNKWRLLFWALDDEVTRVMRDAPDFWAFVNQTIELPEVPSPAEQTRLAGELAWVGFDDTELRQLSSVERKARIALRERLLAELPDEDANRSTRADLHYTLGGLYSYGGQLATAEQHLQTALELAKQTNNVDAHAQALNGLGNVYRDQSRYEEAIVVYRQAIELDPKFVIPWNGLGNVHYDHGRYDEAIATYRQAIELNPKFVSPWNGLGNIHHNQGRYDEAIVAYRQAIELDPKSAIPWNGLGSAYYSQGRYEEAIVAYRQAIELGPKYAYPWNGLGSAHYSQGRYEEALSAYRQAIELDPKYATPWNNLGSVYTDQGRYDEAIAAYSQAIELDHKDADYWNNMGDVYRYQGRYEEAIAAYHQVIELASKNIDPYTMLGALYELTGRLEDALREHQQAVELEPDRAFRHASLASVLHKLGHEAEAAEHLARARELMSGEDKYNKACIEAIAGNSDVALAHLEKALSQVHGNRDWARHDPDLASLHDDPRFWELVGMPPDEETGT